MKKYLSILLAICFSAGFTSCEKDLELYNESICRLNFYYANVESRSDFYSDYAEETYTFVYGPADLKEDTLWYEVETMGFLSDHDRAISVVQVPTDGNDAEPGKHYIAFNDPKLSSKYIIPAGKSRTKIPVVLIRDISLKEKSVTLRFSLQANENFQLGYPEFSTRQITFTDQLTEPSEWSYNPFPEYGDYSLKSYFGAWGPVKFQFFIEETGKKWDDEYLKELRDGDNTYFIYILRKLYRRLNEVNAERMAQGLDILREADGTPVAIDGEKAIYYL